MEFDELSQRIIGCAIEVHRISTSRNCKTALNVSSYEMLRALRVLRGGNYFITEPRGRMTLPKVSLSTWANPA